MTKNNKQATKRNRYSVRASFYNFSINTGFPALTNPCNSSVIRKIFKRPHAIQWNIVDKETVDEIIFRTTNQRNRLILELMARGGMRVGEVLNLKPADIQERSLAIQNPKSGRAGETVYVPQKLLVRLTAYTKAKNIDSNARIFPISYVAACSIESNDYYDFWPPIITGLRGASPGADCLVMGECELPRFFGPT
ncbi:MAG: site-specific integrase [Desulfofustis sp.]|nr:site-specific integrase [Desulfofustis sp.]